VAFDTGAVFPVWDRKPKERHGADVTADREFNLALQARPLSARATAIEPGVEKLIGQVVALDDRGSHMSAEHRRAVVSATGVPALSCPWCCLRRPHSVALLVEVSAWVPTRTTRSLPLPRISPFS